MCSTTPLQFPRGFGSWSDQPCSPSPQRCSRNETLICIHYPCTESTTHVLHPFIERCAPGFQFTGCRTCQHSTCIDIYSYQHLQVLPSCFCSVKCMSPVPAVLILPQVPVRSRQCQHSACFDLSSYLHLRAAAAKAKREGGRAQAARCPLCMSELHWEALFCDGLS